MSEHLFLCGLNEAQRALYGPGREFHLRGPSANVRLRIDDLRHRHLRIEPELLTDLLEIAFYVFAADCALSRGGPTLKDFGRRWRRALHLVIAVRQPGIWTEPHRLHCLREALGFLTEDGWSFEFVKLADPPSIQDYLPYSPSDDERPSAGTIILFSGGLDSFAGAAAELSQGERHVVLLSRRLVGITDQRQRELASVLKERCPKRVTHVRADAGLTVKANIQEHTQRSRSFLLTALATAAAYMEQSDRILFYENGIMSINLPIATQVVGARASRSTHPRSLMLLQQLARSIQAEDVRIENPFIWKTKTEIVRELKDKQEGVYIARTLSCSKTREISNYKPHCRTCAQCLQRRLSTLGAGAYDLDPAEAYAIDLLTGARDPGEDRMMAADMIRSALEFRGLTDEQFAIRFAGEFASFTDSFPGHGLSEVARRTADIYRRHGEFVRGVFSQAASDHAADLIDQALPDSCLLLIAIGAPEMESGDAPIEPVRQNDPLNECAGTLAVANDDEIRLAVDSHRKQIVIDGLAPLTSPTEYRIISVLVELFREDRNAELAPENFRTFPAEKLAEEVSSTGDQSGRKTVSRLRSKIDAEHRKLYGRPLGRHAVIENVRGKGYRINPSVRVVSPSELQRG